MTGSGVLGTSPVQGLIETEREVTLLRDIVAVVSTGPGIESLAAAVARMITAATRSDVCLVHILDDSQRSLTLAGATPPLDKDVGRLSVALGCGFSGWVASHQEPLVITENVHADPRYAPIGSLPGSDVGSVASVPMAAGQAGLVGVLEVHTIERREFTARDVELLLVIGRLIAGAFHQARLHRQLTVRERDHENFTEQVVAAQENERRRLAGDIHDGISQRLVTLAYRLDAAAGELRDDIDEAAEQLEKARELVTLTLQEARSAISGLRPPVLDDLGLAGGLASLAALSPVDTDVELADDRLPEHIEIALYRIAQECLQNVIKHSGAHVVMLRFSVRNDTARLEVADDGMGFDLTTDQRNRSGAGGGYGLMSMSERAELIGGRLTIRSRPGSGTVVVVTVPLDGEGAGAAAVG